MRHAICKHHPRRQRRKFHANIWGNRLERRILLQIIVESQHEHVVRRAAHRANPQFRSQALHRSPKKRIVLCNLLQPGGFRVLLRQRVETFRRRPYPRPRRIQIREYAQNSSAAPLFPRSRTLRAEYLRSAGRKHFCAAAARSIPARAKIAGPRRANQTAIRKKKVSARAPPARNKPARVLPAARPQPSRGGTYSPTH